MSYSVESVSSSEWEALCLAEMMASGEASTSNSTTTSSAFRPASSLPSTAPASSPTFAPTASGIRPHASRFQIQSGPTQQMSSPTNRNPRPGSTPSPISSSHRPPASPASSLSPPSAPQLQFTAASPSSSSSSSSATPYSRPQGNMQQPNRPPPPSASSVTPAANRKPQFDNPYQKQREEKDKSFGFSYTPASGGAGGGAGGMYRSTHNRFNKNPSIFGSADASSSFNDETPESVCADDDNDFQPASSLPPQTPQPSRGPSSSSSSTSAFAYPSPSSSPYPAPRGGPPQYQQQQQQQFRSPQQQQQQQQQQRGPAPPAQAAFPQPRPPSFSGNGPPVPIDVQLVERDRFGAGEPHKRDKWLIDFYSSVPGSKFDCLSKMWTFPLSCYAPFTRAIENTRGVTLNAPLPPWIMRLFVYKEKAPLNTNVRLDKIPAELLTALYPFQREGVIFAVQRNGRALIADEMGLGKTMQAIAVAAYYKEDWPLLVVAPSTVRVQWAENFEKWIPGLRSDQIKVIMKTKDEPDGLVNIISYDLVVRQANIAQKKFRVIIADESHTIKNWKAKRTTNLQPLLKTPALSRPNELFTQLQALDPQVFSRMADFGVRYCAGHQTRFCWDFSGSSNLKELNLLLQETVMIRRLKCDVLAELPQKKRHQVFLGIIDKHKKIIGGINQKVKEHKKMLHIASNDEAARNARFEAWRLIKELYHNTGTAKLPAVTEYIKEMLKTKNKILVFAYHHDVMDGIGLLLEREEIEYIRIDGMTPPQHRQELVDHFQKQPSCRAAVLGLTSAGVGITLTKAEAVIMTELFWNPGILRQAEDRAHRIGVEHEVEVFYLVARGTLDESIWEMIQHKLDVLGNTLNGEQEVLDAEEIEGKAPDGSTIDVFMEKILQKVDNFEEREKAYQERRLQQQRDAEMMNQIMREDHQQQQQTLSPSYGNDTTATTATNGSGGSRGGFQPAIYFDAADAALEAAEEELDEVKRETARAKGKTARGITLGRGGKVVRAPAAKRRKPTETAPAAKRGGAKRKAVQEEEEEEEEDGREEEVVDEEDDGEVAWPEVEPVALPSWSTKRVAEEKRFLANNGAGRGEHDDNDDDDFESTPSGGKRLSLRPTSYSHSRSPSPPKVGNGRGPPASARGAGGGAGSALKKRRILLDDVEALEDEEETTTAVVEDRYNEYDDFTDYGGREDADAMEEEGRAVAATSPRSAASMPATAAARNALIASFSWQPTKRGERGAGGGGTAGDEEEQESHHRRRAGMEATTARADEDEGEEDDGVMETTYATRNRAVTRSATQPVARRPAPLVIPSSQQRSAVAAAAPGEVPRAGQLGRFSFGGGRRLANRD